jgi:predicted membrane chloride channel (bestrophin family)
MIYYEPGYWGVGVLWKLNGSVFPKALVWALPCSIFAVVAHYLMNNEMDGNQKKTFGVTEAGVTSFGAFSFVLGFLITFRSQKAYDRWWEGGTLLQQLRGEWFNSFSCLVAFCNSAQEKQKDVHKFQRQLVRLYSLLYGCALEQVSSMQVNSFELINLNGFDEDSLYFLKRAPDRCEIVLQWIQRAIVENDQKQILKIAPPILSRVYNELGNGIVNLNNARKIKQFPIPFPFAQMITVMLLFHAVLTPMICASTMETALWAGAVTFVVTFCYWTIMYIALELEMPYGDDPNDLPLRDMAEDMNKSLCWMIQPQASVVPMFDQEEVNQALAKGAASCYEDTDELACWTVDLEELETTSKTSQRPKPTPATAHGPPQFIPRSHTLRPRENGLSCRVSRTEGQGINNVGGSSVVQILSKEPLPLDYRQMPPPAIGTSSGPREAAQDSSKGVALALPSAAANTARLENHVLPSTSVGSATSPLPDPSTKVEGTASSDMTPKRVAWGDAMNPPEKATVETVKDENLPPSRITA